MSSRVTQTGRQTAVYSRQLWWEKTYAASWERAKNKAECQIQPGTLLGQASSIGFSSGPHLHYTVYVDRNNNGAFETDEVVDPMIAQNMVR